VEGKKITDQQTIAETFNDYFVAIAEIVERKEKIILLMMITIVWIIILISWNKLLIKLTQAWRANTSTKENEQIIKSLKTKTSYGYKISTKIIKLSGPFISSPINYILNKMLSWSVFPDRLKYAIIKPLHNNGDRCDVSKYRSVSLLTSFSKIFETLMQRKILKHLTKYIKLSTEHGFRLGLRTDNATYKLTTEILNIMNNKLLVGGIFCDLEKHLIVLIMISYYLD
jgi:hypothetical protein